VTTPRKPETSSESRARSQAGLGRRIATTVVVCGLAYLILVGIGSVVPQVFWPAKATIDPAITCDEGLRDLRAELLAFAGEHVARGGSADRDAVRNFLGPWDLRHRGLEARCEGDERDAWVLLGQMRERLQGTLYRFDAEEGALARAVDLDLTPARQER
jgi:hypothetical protein